MVSTLEDLAVDNAVSSSPATNMAKVAAANLAAVAAAKSTRAKKPLTISSSPSSAVIVLEDIDMDSSNSKSSDGGKQLGGAVRRRDNTKTTKPTKPTTTSASSSISKGKKIPITPPLPPSKVGNSRRDDRKLMEEDNEINA